MKLFFYVFGNITVAKFNACPHGLNVFFRRISKFIVFSAVFFPCLFQFPLIAFGQNWHNISDSFFIQREPFGHITKIKFPNTFEVGNLRLESFFELGDMRPNATYIVSPFNEPMHSDNTKQSNNNTDAKDRIIKKNVSQFPWPWFWVLFFFNLYLLLYPLFEKQPNV